MKIKQLNLLVKYLDARKRIAQMEAIQMDGGQDRVSEARKDEYKTLQALIESCPDYTPEKLKTARQPVEFENPELGEEG